MLALCRVHNEKMESWECVSINRSAIDYIWVGSTNNYFNESNLHASTSELWLLPHKMLIAGISLDSVPSFGDDLIKRLPRNKNHVFIDFNWTRFTVCIVQCRFKYFRFSLANSYSLVPINKFIDAFSALFLLPPVHLRRVEYAAKTAWLYLGPKYKNLYTSNLLVFCFAFCRFSRVNNIYKTWKIEWQIKWKSSEYFRSSNSQGA